MAKPVLSIGIIFRDDIRSIERCLTALEPLRAAVSCELVMADTGSADGSRAVAERFADILIDFPWINDFSAARNAVMDRCSGQWFITVDTDEYLDRDVSELVNFLKHRKKQINDFCVVVVRNYDTYEMDLDYTDFSAIRMVRMSTGVRYTGAIHERWNLKPGGTLNATPLMKTVFHHDGYVGLYSEAGRAKRERNLALIRKQLEETPDDILTRLQFIESGREEEDFLEQLYRSAELVRQRASGWKNIGPPVMRYAVMFGQVRKLPETEEWIQWMDENMPESFFTRMDAAYFAAVYYHLKRDFRQCIAYGEKYMAAQRDYKAGRAGPAAQVYSILKTASPYWEQALKILLSNAYSKEKKFERALELLQTLDHYTGFDQNHITNLLLTLKDIHRFTELDTAPAITAFWRELSRPEPNQARADERVKAFIEAGAKLFRPKTRRIDEFMTDILRPSFTLFAPLDGECELGTAAVIWSETDPEALTRKLSGVNWERIPIHILSYALDCGAAFPPADKPMNLEEMDVLALRLAKGDIAHMPELIRRSENSGSVPALAWTRALAMAAVKVFRWNDPKVNGEQAMELARGFAAAEKAFLPVCYAGQALSGDGLFLLPPMHRFGWYCAQAFDALEQGSPAEYVRLLRMGLESCNGMKNMVEFLAEHTEEIRKMLAPAELKALADQVRMILVRFSPDDPAVAALKQSEAYRRVAYLIEGTPAPVWGGLPQ